MSLFITHTPLTSLQAVGPQGAGGYARLTTLAKRHLSEKHAAIIATPVPLKDGSGIDWYLEDDAEVVSLASLSDAEKQAVEEKLRNYLADYAECAEKLSKGDNTQSSAATTLRNATIFPGHDYIYAVKTEEGIEPIIIACGYENRDVSTAKSFDLSVVGTKKAPRRKSHVPLEQAGETPSTATNTTGGDIETPSARQTSFEKNPSIVNPIRQGRRPWGFSLINILLGLLGLLLFALIVGFLLPACGLRTPFGTIVFGLPFQTSCDATQTSELSQSITEGHHLERELQVLREEYQRRRLACYAQPLRPAEPVIPVEQPEEPRRVERRGEAQITLIWDTEDDLDLAITCPNNNQISYSTKGNLICGGILDIDRNSKDTNTVTRPVENITFPQGLIASGEHSIVITNYKDRGSKQPIPYTLTIRQGEEKIVHRGEIPPKLGNIKPVVLIDRIRK